MTGPWARLRELAECPMAPRTHVAGPAWATSSFTVESRRRGRRFASADVDGAWTRHAAAPDGAYRRATRARRVTGVWSWRSTATASRCSWTARSTSFRWSATAAAPAMRRPASHAEPLDRPDARPRREGPRRAGARRCGEGDVLVTLEAMKMELPLRAPRDGTRPRDRLPRGRARAARRRPGGAGMSDAIARPHRPSARRRPHRRGRAARRPAERGASSCRRPTRSRSSTCSSAAGLPVIEVDRVRQPEVGAADGRRGRGVRGHRAARRAPATRRSCPNARGLERAVAAGVDEVADLRRRLRDVQPAQHQPGHRGVARRVRGGVSPGARRGRHASAATCRRASAARSKATCRPARVADLAGRLLALGVFEVALSDTIGVAHPGQVWTVLDAVRPRVPARARSRCTSTTRAARRSPTCSRPCSAASRRSTRRPADSAAARSRPARPATSRPRIWSICSTGSASRPASACARCWPRRASSRRASSTRCRRGSTRRNGPGRRLANA